MLLEIAGVYATRSTCSRLAVGALVVRDGRILTTGYNGSPAGMNHCTHTCDCGGKAGFAESHWPACRHLKACVEAVHAEANAIAFAARYGMSTDCSEMFVTHSPCEACAKLIINAGIRRVTYRIEFRSMAGIDLLEKAGVETLCLPA